MQFHYPEWHDRLTSTNTILCDRLLQDEPLPNGFVLAAHQQTAGKGQLGRSWPQLDLSFLLQPIKRIHQITALPMAVAISLEQYGLTVQTKWPMICWFANAKFVVF